MGQRVGEERSAVLSTSCVEICSSPKMKGATKIAKRVRALDQSVAL